MSLIDRMDIKEWLAYNAKLQQKKNSLRKALKEKGILKRGGHNTYDNYKYFSEAQYKELFTELFSANGLELGFNELEYESFKGSEKMSNGRIIKLRFTLTDIETGFFEETEISGEAMDKGDKAGYKAYTGALKYFLADSFLVATGDDPETESPEQEMNDKKVRTASPKQVELLRKLYTEEDHQKMLHANGVEKLEDIPLAKASEYIGRKTKGEKK